MKLFEKLGLQSSTVIERITLVHSDGIRVIRIEHREGETFFRNPDADWFNDEFGRKRFPNLQAALDDGWIVWPPLEEQQLGR